MSGRRGKVVSAIVGMAWLIGATAGAAGAAELVVPGRAEQLAVSGTAWVAVGAVVVRVDEGSVTVVRTPRQQADPADAPQEMTFRLDGSTKVLLDTRVIERVNSNFDVIRASGTRHGALADIKPGRQAILFAVDGAARQVWLDSAPTVEPRATTRPAPGTASPPAHGDRPPAPQRPAATRPEARARFMEDGERGKVVRADERSVTIVPLPRMRLVRSDPPAPQGEELPEKTFKIDAKTVVMIGVVTAERMTDRGETIRTMEMHHASVVAIKPDLEVVIQAGEDGIARRVMVLPVPLIEPRDAAATLPTTRSRPTTRRGAGSIVISGVRGKVVATDEQSITIVPTEGPGSEPPPDKPGALPREKTFRLDDRTRVLIPRLSGEVRTADGRSSRKISFEIGQLTDLRPGLDVAISDPGDKGVARRITVVPESFGETSR